MPFIEGHFLNPTIDTQHSMKAKSYGLTDLAQLQKDLKKQAEARAQAEKAAKAQQALEQRMSNEFLSEVRGVTPIKSKDRYLHPTTQIEPAVRAHSDHEEKHAQHRERHNRKSDQFDARHLRDDENGTYLRKGIPDTLLKKLQKGAWEIAARIDLHGKTVEEARIATSAFLYQSVQQNHRTVSIIHGQGFNSDNNDATLRSHVKNWLVQNPNVLAFCHAPKNAGGHGAVVVLLHQDKPKTA